MTEGSGAMRGGLLSRCLFVYYEYLVEQTANTAGGGGVQSEMGAGPNGDRGVGSDEGGTVF